MADKEPVGRPASVLIGPYRWRISYDQEDIEKARLAAKDPHRCGDCDDVQLLLSIEPGMALDTERDTVLHETLHAMIHQTGIPEACCLTYLTEEALVGSLTPLLVQLLRQNRDFLAYLLGDETH